MQSLHSGLLSHSPRHCRPPAGQRNRTLFPQQPSQRAAHNGAGCGTSGKLRATIANLPHHRRGADSISRRLRPATSGRRATIAARPFSRRALCGRRLSWAARTTASHPKTIDGRRDFPDPPQSRAERAAKAAASVINKRTQELSKGNPGRSILFWRLTGGGCRNGLTD